MARGGLISLVMAVTLLTAGCGGRESSDHTPRSVNRSQRLTDLRDIAQLRSVFNSRSGEPRLILLVSPT
jgi:hypothetical protein